MIILVINCGSSSIKYQLLDMKNDDLYDIIAKGIVEKIGLPMGILQYAPAGGEKQVIDLLYRAKGALKKQLEKEGYSYDGL